MRISVVHWSWLREQALQRTIKAVSLPPFVSSFLLPFSLGERPDLSKVLLQVTGGEVGVNARKKGNT